MNFKSDIFSQVRGILVQTWLNCGSNSRDWWRKCLQVKLRFRESTKFSTNLCMLCPFQLTEGVFCHELQQQSELAECGRLDLSAILHQQNYWDIWSNRLDGQSCRIKGRTMKDLTLSGEGKEVGLRGQGAIKIFLAKPRIKVFDNGRG